MRGEQLDMHRHTGLQGAAPLMGLLYNVLSVWSDVIMEQYQAV